MLNKIFSILFFLSIYSCAFSQNENEYLLINEINIEGNNKTRNQIILRELIFSVNDSLKFSDIEKFIQISKANLLKTPLFNFVDIKYSLNPEKKLNIKIIVTERWYLWPELTFYYADRNFSNWLKIKDLNHLDYGGGIVKYNFRGRNEIVDFFAIFGYNRLLLFNYKNISIDKNRNHLIGFSFKKLNRKETTYIIENDQVQWLRLEKNDVLTTYSIYFTYTFRPKIKNLHTVSLGFENRNADDSLLILNILYFPNQSNTVNYLYFKYVFSHDTRNSRIFPVKGAKNDFIISKYGLGILPESKINTLSISEDFSTYYKITTRFYAGHNFVIKKYFDSQRPYFLYQALGYGYDIRGFEYNVVAGDEFFLQKNTLNYQLLKKKNFDIKFIPYKSISKTFVEIYLSFYLDFAYVNNYEALYNQHNMLANKFLSSAGAGINFITYYDKLLRIEFSYTNMNTKGFFIHFEAPF